LLSRLRKEKELSLILISHDDEVISSLADKVIFISEGKIIDRVSKTQFNKTHPVP
jgi:ABC-type glutathione transport system ATPase component